jgi:hypothetical protein
MIKVESETISLPTFLPAAGLPSAADEMRRALGSRVVRSIRSYSLGPEGTNIIRAAMKWHADMGVAHKAKVIPCATVEESVRLTQSDTTDGQLSIFWTCAVYFRENQVFFGNPDVLPFMFSQVLPLDEMQLACQPRLAAELAIGAVTRNWRILTHLSPSPLVKKLGCELLEANSNADAAVRCAAGEAEACITTEAARRRTGLVKLHSFGSPDMVFFGGIARHGIALLTRAHEDNQSQMALPLNSAAA